VDNVAKCGQTGHHIWKTLSVDSIIVLQLHFEEFVCKIFYTLKQQTDFLKSNIMMRLKQAVPMKQPAFLKLKKTK
jgi:hypothetical protein